MLNDRPPPADAHAPTLRPADDRRSFIRFIVLLATAALLLRILLFSPFYIPSESMQPGLLIGDYLMVDKTAYGWSRHSIPFSPPLFSGRAFGKLPERGDVVVFKAPGDGKDYIKRVVGLPGDQLQMRRGILYLNGWPVEKRAVEDFRVAVAPNMVAAHRAQPCFLPIFAITDVRGGQACRYPRYRETIGARRYEILDLASFPGDSTPVYVVPTETLFLLGDNRDRSADSRFGTGVGGIGYVPIENLVGRARFIFFSTDGSARWLNPISWAGAARWDRVGRDI